MITVPALCMSITYISQRGLNEYKRLTDIQITVETVNPELSLIRTNLCTQMRQMSYPNIFSLYTNVPVNKCHIPAKNYLRIIVDIVSLENRHIDYRVLLFMQRVAKSRGGEFPQGREHEASP